jgi:hypothetical protein
MRRGAIVSRSRALHDSPGANHEQRFLLASAYAHLGDDDCLEVLSRAIVRGRLSPTTVLFHSPAVHEMPDYRNQREYQQDMDQPAADWHYERSERPKQHKYHADR